MVYIFQPDWVKVRNRLLVCRHAMSLCPDPTQEHHFSHNSEQIIIDFPRSSCFPLQWAYSLTKPCDYLPKRPHSPHMRPRIDRAMEGAANHLENECYHGRYKRHTVLWQTGHGLHPLSNEQNRSSPTIIAPACIKPRPDSANVEEHPNHKAYEYDPPTYLVTKFQHCSLSYACRW